jgi:hypothetical protein
MRKGLTGEGILPRRSGGRPRRLIEHAVGGLAQQRFHFTTEVFAAGGGFFQERGTTLGRAFENGVVQAFDLPPPFLIHTMW